MDDAPKGPSADKPRWQCPKLLLLIVITLLRIVANVFFGWAVEFWACTHKPICADSGCTRFAGVRLDCNDVRLARHVTLTSMWESPVQDGKYIIDYTFFVQCVVGPLTTGLGVLILLLRADRFSAWSRLHVWSYRTILLLYVTSVVADESVTGLIGHESGAVWSSTQFYAFLSGVALSNILQIGTANLKLQCLGWNRLASWAMLLVGISIFAGLSSVVITEVVKGFEAQPHFVVAILAVGLLLIFFALMFLIGPLQSLGMWCAVCKAVYVFSWDEIRWEATFLCITAFLTMMGPLFSAVVWTLSNPSMCFATGLCIEFRTRQLMFASDISIQIFYCLVLCGMIGPQKWSRQSDAFTKLGALDGYGLAAKRIAFPGKINPSTDKCIVSFPGIYSEEWDRAVAVADAEQICSLACVFLTDTSSGLGQHAENPDSPGECYCKALYGIIPVEAYVSELDASAGIEKHQLAFKRADAKAMGQHLIIKYPHTTFLEWQEEKATAKRRADELWRQNQGRAPWGCTWFHLWKENVDKAVEQHQPLHVFYFEGRVGAGKLSWEQLSDQEARRKARKCGGLGNSQTAEVAYLEKLDLPYVEQDVTDFNSFISEASAVTSPEIVIEICEPDSKVKL